MTQTSMLPDLLEPTPRARLDFKKLERATDFAFASAGTYTELDDCLDRAKEPATTWDPSSYERALFVRELIATSFPIVIEGTSYAPSQAHLLSLFSRPPSDGAIAEHRRAILRELSQNETERKALEKIYVQLRRLKELLGPKEASELPAPARRRMEIISVVRGLFDTLANGFEKATSGLSALRDFGQYVQGTAGFKSVISLLELEQNLAVIDTRLRIARDGTLRSVEIVRVEENVTNLHYEPPMLRAWRRFVRFVRGYIFRGEEIRDVIVDNVFTGIRPEVVKLFQLQGDIEFHLASLGFRDAVMKRSLSVCLPEIVDVPASPKTEQRSLEGLFNPHLLGEGKGPVPCGLTFERYDAIAIFTGPNSGGKTRLLQALALTQMLGQAGTFVPARAARLIAANGMFVSLIEEARADQKEGRLGTELLRIRDVFERLSPGGAVLLDELCSGTNPSEGEEIFELVTSLLSELSPQAFITTHFLDFAARLSAQTTDDSLLFYRVSLDQNEEPTYQFERGVAQSSLAKKTAARLGVTRETLRELIAKSRARSGTSNRLTR